jgi:hypothetical protein
MSPRVEIAVQAHPSKMSYGMPRNQWFRELLSYIISDKYNINLAVHINREWCDEICRKGSFPKDLLDFVDPRLNDTVTKKPPIKRWQLNMPKDAADNINVHALKRIFDLCPDKEFIIQYNNNTKNAVNQLYNSGARFSVLYDASGGQGILPTSWSAPVYKSVPQGYSGGLSPENVSTNLDKISYVVADNRPIWIDAEGKLKIDDKFNIVRARQYIENAENWIAQQQQNQR